MTKSENCIRDPHFDYMKNQPHLSPSMRALVVDWFVELGDEYKLKPETLHLAVNIMDRVLSKSELKTNTEKNACSSDFAYEQRYGDASSTDDDSVDSLTSDEHDYGDDNSERKDKIHMYKGFVVKTKMLQCVGCACMMIAAKLEEVTAPTSKDFAYISDSTYTKKQITKMERNICMHLGFQLGGVTPFMYFHRFIRASQEGDSKPRNLVLENLCYYLLELSLLDYGLVGVRNSLVMASVVYLGRATLRITSQHFPPKTGSDASDQDSYGTSAFWSPTLRYYTGYEKWDLKDVVTILHSLHATAEDRKDDLKAVYNKYRNKKYNRVALKTVVREEDLGF